MSRVSHSGIGGGGAPAGSSRNVVTFSVVVLLLSIVTGLWLIDGRLNSVQTRAGQRRAPLTNVSSPLQQGSSDDSNGTAPVELEGNKTLWAPTVTAAPPATPDLSAPPPPPPPTAEPSDAPSPLAIPQRAVQDDGIGSPRLQRRSSMKSVPWTADDEVRKSRALEPVLASCGSGPQMAVRDDAGPSSQAGNRSGTGVIVENRMRRMHLVGHRDLECGRWSRFWAVALCRNLSITRSDASGDDDGGGGAPQDNGGGEAAWVPCCDGRNKIEVQMQSTDAKVSAERVYELDHGVFEVQVFIRKCSARYVIGVDLISSNSALPWLLNSDHPRNLTADLRRVPRAEKRRVICHKTRGFPDNRLMLFVDVAVTSGVDIVPINRRCDDAAEFRSQPLDLRDRFRYGSWYHLPGGVCDGVHCDGDTREWLTEGWVWVADLCRVQLYNRQAIHAILSGRKMFSWGTSLLRQPTANLMYYHVGKHMKLSMKGLGFDITFPPRHGKGGGLPIHAVFRAATCNAFVIRKDDCVNKSGEPIGFPTWRIAQKDFVKTRPSFVVIDRSTWIPDPKDEIQYMRDLEDWIQRFRSEDLTRLPQKPLSVIMLGSTASENSGIRRPCGFSAGQTQAHRNWLVEDHIMANHSDVFSFASRYDMTFPLHFGSEFVHGSSHYGASPYLCNLAFAVRGGKDTAYTASNCVRKLHGDEALLLAWLNMFKAAG